MMQADLFGDTASHLPGTRQSLGSDAAILRGFALNHAEVLLTEIANVTQTAPFRHLETRSGQMSVAMSNCGVTGWVSDRSGYRYDPVDPLRGAAWPAMPAVFQLVACQAAAAMGFPDFQPDACLINRYVPGTKLSLHQDRDEHDAVAPIVSVSLGIPAVFLWGGASRTTRPQRIALFHGDVVVWGGPSRMTFHGVDTVPVAAHPLTGQVRYNLTFRKVF